MHIRRKENQKGYRLIQKSTHKLIISRDVIFFENRMANRGESSNHQLLQIEIRPNELREDESNGNSSSADIYDSSIELNVTNQTNNTFTDAIDNNSGVHNSTMVNATAETDFDDTVASTADDRVRDPDYRARITTDDTEPAVTRGLSRFLSNPFGGFSFFSVTDALSGPEKADWHAAMNEELKSLEENRTWDLVTLPEGKRALNCKWVLRKKTDEKGNLEKFKARLVIKGCAQREGIDFDEVYSPVVRYVSIRYLISIAVQFDMHIFQMDAVTAFLQGDLSDEIYMRQPEHFHDNTPRVCKLRKSIYGLKQASRIWNKKFSDVLTKAGYARSTMDPCVYFKFVGDRMIFISIYVDDVLIFTNCMNLKLELQNILTSNFKMKDLGTAKFCVGLHITRDKSNNTIYLDQTKYIEEMLDKFGMTDCNPIDTPCDANQRLVKEERTSDFDPSTVPYQQAIGCILYLTQGTRPDIAFAINNLSRYNNCFTKTHWMAVKRVLRYLKGTKNLRLAFRKDENDYMIGYCDADWATDMDERRSCTGYIFLRSSGAISWNSKRQPTVALSTAEAEYMSLSSATQEGMWLKNF